MKKLALLFQILSISVFSQIQPSELTLNERNNLQLIRELEHFGRHTIKLKLHNHFYKKWQKQEQKNTYLYVSRPDSILLPNGFRPFEFFGTDTAGARLKADSCSKVGYDAMIYHTSGTSAVLLTRYLLNYPPEAVVFVVLHEMAHVYRNSARLKIPYAAEESFGDFLGNNAGEYFIRKYHPEWLESFLIQKSVHESIYKLLATTEAKVQGIPLEQKNQIYSQTNSDLKEILFRGNQFIIDRFSYPVNHAYLLRNRYYYRWYWQFISEYSHVNSWKEIRKYYQSFPLHE
ncbi:MAG TPA: hypothetical protein PL185_08565 [Flavobacteriales bacterium]|nr:hypothetical protein [Flavobacteriales bacterium]HPH82616.1 hypothetical protein [Flavobacteriales bacterium]